MRFERSVSLSVLQKLERILHDDYSLSGDNISSTEAGFFLDRLDEAKRWLGEHVGDGNYHIVIVRGGQIVSEWNQGIGRDGQSKYAYGFWNNDHPQH